MRIADIKIGDVSYPATYTLGTRIALEERGIDMARVDWSTASGYQVIALITECIISGCSWARKNGRPVPELPAEKEMAALIGMDDLKDTMQVISRLIIGDRHVEAKPDGKNGESQSAD